MKNLSTAPGLALFACTALLALGAAGTAHSQAAAQTEWGAIFKDKSGETPVVEPVEKYTDKQWLSLQFRPFTGLRPRVAVAPMTTCADAMAQSEKIGNLLETSLVHSNRFVVLSRADLQRVTDEQGLGASGLVTPATAAKVGMLLGAQFIVLASVDEWIPEAERSNAQFQKSEYLRGLNVNLRTTKSVVVMTIKVIDAMTGQIAFSETVNGTTGTSNFGLFGAFRDAAMPDWMKQVDIGLDKQAPITDALVSAVNKAVYRVTMGLRDKPWQGMVADADADQIYIDGGSSVGLTEGLELNIFTRLGEIISPTTGQPIGYKMKPNGAVRVTGADENLAYATVIRGCKGVKKGDIVRIPSAVGARVATPAPEAEAPMVQADKPASRTNARAMKTNVR